MCCVNLEYGEVFGFLILENLGIMFYILLTVHLGTIHVNNQLEALF